MWMAMVIGATMAIIMLAFMWTMSKDCTTNLAIDIGSLVVFGVSLWLVRSLQTMDTVGEVSYMKAMISHHSIAIMTSERAHVRDPRVRKLAGGIIEGRLERDDKSDRRPLAQSFGVGCS
jgi:uncharacterized protein (DUF305 family)